MLVISQPFLKVMSKTDALSSGLPVYLKLSMDDQDSVRLLTVEDLIVLAAHLVPEEVETHLLEPLRRTSTDKSWRVRYMIATHFVEVRAHDIRLCAPHS